MEVKEGHIRKYMFYAGALATTMLIVTLTLQFRDRYKTHKLKKTKT